MNFLIVSDSHGDSEYFSKLLKEYKDYFVIHLGDRGFDVEKYLENREYILVDGNCDRYTYQKDAYLDYKNHKILLTHGDLYGVKYDFNKLYFKALQEKCDVVMFGHTHHQESFEYNNIKFINPGALNLHKYAIIKDDEIILK